MGGWAHTGVVLVICAAAASLGGCRQIHVQQQPPLVSAPVYHPFSDQTPRELAKGILPEYVVEPPDILVIEAINLIPQQPYQLRVADALLIQVRNAFPDEPINQAYIVEPGGLVNLGLTYGTVSVVGLTVEEATKAVTEQLQKVLESPQVSISLLEMAGQQQINGEHLVGPDGTVRLGSYGNVSVVGMTLDEAEAAIEAHLSEYLESPEISVSVFAYNSKVYYIIAEGAGFGDQVYRLPVTGNETVLDALSQVNGLSEVSSKKIWIARPTSDAGHIKILPVEWKGITAQGLTSTNYQVLPGDRIFVAEDRLVAFDTRLAKFLAPIERAMGFSLLSAGTASRLSGGVLRGGGNPGNRGF